MVETPLRSEEAETGRHDREPRSLGERAARGAVWTLGGEAALAALRLASNLILTRLLFPEAFGLLALVHVAVLAAEMFSDVGFRGSVISNVRADEPRFLDTVWTIKVLRGVAVSAALALAAPAIASGFDQPLLAVLIPVTGLRLAINGMASTSLLTLLRRVQPARWVFLMVGAQAVAVVAMVGVALWLRSVWVLVLGDLVAAMVRSVASHFLVPGYRNRFAWDREAVRDVFGFGRWIWVSTMATFLLLQGDRAVLATMMTAAELGVYSIAFALCSMIVGTAQQLSGNLLFPVYSELARQAGGAGLQRIRRARGLALLCFLPPICLLVVAGPWIVDVMYDDRYIDAGLMLQILAAGAIPHLLVVTAERGLLAFGDSFRHMALQVSSAALFVVGLGLGAIVGGTIGLMVGGALARLVAYGPYAALSRRYGFGTPGLDALALAAAAAVCALGLGAMGMRP